MPNGAWRHARSSGPRMTITRPPRRSLATMRMGKGRPQASSWYSKSMSQICLNRSKLVGQGTPLPDNGMLRAVNDSAVECDLEQRRQVEVRRPLRLGQLAIRLLQHEIPLVLIPARDLQ